MKKLLLTTAVLAATVAFGAKAHADSNVYRLYNHNTGEHFYTTSLAEKNKDVSVGWSYEGIGWVAPSKGTAVYRVYNPNSGGDHYYTKSKFEAQSLVKSGWHWDYGGKPVFYSGGKTPVYVAYNPNAQSGAHNFTDSLGEENSLISADWKFKAVAFDAVAQGKPAPVASGMNLSQIAQGNYSSIQGTWSDSWGKRIVVSGNKIVLPDEGGTYTNLNFSDNFGNSGLAKAVYGSNFLEIDPFPFGPETSLVNFVTKGSPLSGFGEPGDGSIDKQFVGNAANDTMIIGDTTGTQQTYGAFYKIN